MNNTKQLLKQPLPCPFCGGKAYIDFCYNQPYINCFHLKTCLRPDTWLISSLPINKQIEKWNMRAKNE